MKRIVTVLLVIVLTAPAIIAQETLRDVIRDYQNNNSEITLVIPSFLIKAGIAFSDMEEEEKETLKLVDNIKIVICENQFHSTNLSALEEGIKNGSFVEIITIQEQGEKVRMIMNKKTKRKSELLMLVESDNENVLMLINFHGKPDFSKLVCLVD